MGTLTCWEKELRAEVICLLTRFMLSAAAPWTSVRPRSLWFLIETDHLL